MALFGLGALLTFILLPSRQRLAQLRPVPVSAPVPAAPVPAEAGPRDGSLARPACQG